MGQQQESEGQTDRHTDTEKLGPGGLGSLMENPQHPGSSACLSDIVEQRWGYCVQLDKEVRLLCTRRQVWLILVGAVHAGEQSSGHRHPAGESYGGHYPHTLSGPTHRPEEGFAVPLAKPHPKGKVLLIHGSEAIASVVV